MSYNIKVDEKTKMCESLIIDLIKCYKNDGAYTSDLYQKARNDTCIPILEKMSNYCKG